MNLRRDQLSLYINRQDFHNCYSIIMYSVKGQYEGQLCRVNGNSRIDANP